MRIGIDMDGVVCDFVGRFLEKTNFKYNTKIDRSEIVRPNLAKYVNSKLQNQLTVAEDLYLQFCDYEFFVNLDPLKGAIEAIRGLSKENHIIFVTRPVDYGVTSLGKKDWLSKHFSSISYNLILVDSFEAKRLIDVDVMVDDDPRVISNLTTQIPVMINQPWNQDYSNWVCRVDSLSELVDVIKDIE